MTAPVVVGPTQGGFTVALVGPDGAGKSTVTRALVEALPLPAVRVYMGVNLAASAVLLPHTRLYLALKRRRGAPPDMTGPPDPTRAPDRLAGSARARAAVKRGLRVANLVAEEWYRQAVAARHRRRGRVVLFDRHFLADYYFHDVEPTRPRPLSHRLHGWMLRRWYPRPDLVICLDAPAGVAHGRKGEGSREAVDARRSEYLRLAERLAGVVVVDAARPVEEVVAEACDLIVSHARSRCG